MKYILSIMLTCCFIAIGVFSNANALTQPEAIYPATDYVLSPEQARQEGDNTFNSAKERSIINAKGGQYLEFVSQPKLTAYYLRNRITKG